MPIQTHVSIICACHVDEGRRGRGYKVSIGDEGALIDLCPEGKRTYLDPLIALMKRHGRQNQSQVPAGMMGDLSDAWPHAKKQAPPPAPRVASPPPPKRPRGRPPTRASDSTVLLCPVALCGKTMASETGIQQHLDGHHNGLRYSECLRHVHYCGLCDPPVEMLTTSDMGRHARKTHPRAIALERKSGASLALIGAVRRAGDPHGTLAGMDRFITDWLISKATNPQLALGDSGNESAEPTDDHTEDHSQGE